MTIRINNYFILVITAGLLACSGGNQQKEKAERLQALIGGVPWTMGSGKLEIRRRIGRDMLFVSLSDANPPENCRNVFAGNRILFTLPGFGEYDLEQDGITVTLFNEHVKQNIFIQKGTVSLIEDKTTGKIYGKLTAHQDDKNFVDGPFEITVCEPLRRQ